jgi:transketolase
MASALRILAVDAVEKAKSGHPGMPLGMADVATVLFRRFLAYDPACPDWPDRDRFILSAGHGSMLLYGLLHLTGYADMTLEEIRNFRQLGSRSAGHPERGHASGIETTTGPLGQGLANAVGMALAERMLASRFGAELVDHRTYVIAGDGCLMEGISHEAASLAGHLALNKLIVLYDDNGISIDGPTSLAFSDDTLMRFRAYRWNVNRVDGHDPEAIEAAINEARTATMPSLIACKTIIGKGAPKKAGSAASHGSPLGSEEIAGLRQSLGWPHAPFDIPEDIRILWRQAGERARQSRADWTARHERHAEREEFDRVMSGELPAELAQRVATLRQKLCTERPKIATRQSSQLVIDHLVPVLPELVGGSADLTGSNNTKAKNAEAVTPPTYRGNYIYYGVREHGMAAAMNGLALHGGIIPFGGTFLAFTDYCRPAIRLAALMEQRVIFVMTHDSIGLGEDGPTHQPVEHLAALRSIPNLLVLRPADTMETLECWTLALAQKNRPSILVLSRQALPSLRDEDAPENRCARGGYELRPSADERKLTLIATGSEVSIAADAQHRLAEAGIGASLVSLPSWEIFEEQEPSYRDRVLGTAPRLIVEAGVKFGWERYMRPGDRFIGMRGFGASAPAEELYRHFGITAEAILGAAKNML